MVVKVPSPRTVLLSFVVAAVGVLGLRATVLQPPPESAASGGAATAACPAQGRIGSARHGERQTLPASGYTFLFGAGEDKCFPVRFNPCAPVPYVLNDALAPPGGVDDVREAFARLAEATGINFVEEGTTDERLAITREPYQPERYGQRWAPILIGWSALGMGSGPDTSGDDVIVVGRGRPLRQGDVLVSGVLELNVDAVLDRTTGATLPAGFGAGITQGRVILHELGHVVGLGHVSGPAQLMYPELGQHTSPTADFGIGDRAGLRLLGAEAGCLPVPALSEAAS
jgi:hypothetical protein